MLMEAAEEGVEALMQALSLQLTGAAGAAGVAERLPSS